MNETAAQALRQKLMTVPSPKRRHLRWTAGLPYSRKMGCTVYAYQDEGYALWLELEFDHDVKSFNLEPVPLTVSQGDQRFEVPLRGASIDRAEHLTLHFTQAALDKVVGDTVTADLVNAQQWDGLDASIRVWRDLREVNRLDRVNKDMLLRYICAPHVVANAGIEQQIVDLLKKFRKVCVWDVFRNLKTHDEEEIKTALVNLVVKKHLFLDMRVIFSGRSEISGKDIFHA
ncbi:UNVERIFIED_ORG: hypothetical protein J2W38_007067 [Variovorax paradoxus]|nr:hypothetical protein [Variovorax paradoxus]